MKVVKGCKIYYHYKMKVINKYNNMKQEDKQDIINQSTRMAVKQIEEKENRTKIKEFKENDLPEAQYKIGDLVLYRQQDYGSELSYDCYYTGIIKNISFSPLDGIKYFFANKHNLAYEISIAETEIIKLYK